jgi:TRAP-type C4-dicarboxylate transport system permease small subunit
LLERLDRIGRAIENTTLVTLLSSMMVLAVGQIVLRQVFNTGIIWADELIKIIVLWLAMFGSVAAARDNRHIRIDALSHLLPDSAIRYLRIVVDLFAAAVCAVLALYAWRYLQLEIEYQDTLLLDTPAWILHLVIPAAFALISYRFVVGVIARILNVELPGQQEGLH